MKHPNIIQIKVADKECLACGWPAVALYVTAPSDAEGYQAYQQDGGLCAECFLSKVFQKDAWGLEAP